MIARIAAAAAVLAATTTAMGDVGFASKPEAEKAGGNVTIRFAVKGATDVEVAVLGAGGKVVRHLAAGVLGENAPSPLKKNSLTQRLTWDGKDDSGRKATGGPFKVRVALGLRPTLTKIIGQNPGRLGSIVAIATHPKSGELFIFHLSGAIHPNDGTTTCTVFSREGKYLRTILPWPGGLGEEKLRGLKRVDLDGQKIPFVSQGENRAILPGAGELGVNRPVVTGDGRVAFVSHREVGSSKTRYNYPGIKQVTVIDSDGGMSGGKPFRTVLAKYSNALVALALSPDEKTLYAAGLHEGYSKKPKSPHAVWRFGFNDAKPTAFIGNPAKAGAGGDELNGPVDVATDSKGNVYVADRGNDRIAVFSADGGVLGQIAVARPKRVAVHPKTAAVYILSGDAKTNRLTKYASFRAAAPAATATLPRFRYPRPMLMALDASSEPPVLWVASPGGAYAVPPMTLLRIEDAGDAFTRPVDVGKARAKDAIGVGSVKLISLDRARDLLYVNNRVYDVAAGKFVRSMYGVDGLKRGMGSVGRDGNLYLMYYPRVLKRFGPDGKMIPFPASAGKGGALDGPESAGSLRLRTRGVTADAEGNIYAMWQFPEKGAASHGNTNYVTRHGPDGKVLKLKHIDSDLRNFSSPRLDAAGNMYLAVGVRPAGVKVPESFKGQDLGTPWAKGKDTNTWNWYPLMYGCIVKFPPGGGTIRKGSGGTRMEFSYDKDTEITGAEWIHFGASPLPSWRMKYPDTCLCESARIDVDGFGRTFFPDALRFRVGMLDTAGNLIGHFGSFGNVDEPATLPSKTIPVYWPDGITVGNGVVYVGDRLNHRVLSVQLTHAATETVDVK